jgi:hypothetical protein
MSFKRGSCEKIQTGIGKAILVVQGTGKFAPPKSAGHFRPQKGSSDFLKGTPATWIKTRVNT